MHAAVGKWNSSTYRVVPIFKALYAKDRSGTSWLPGLMILGSRAAQVFDHTPHARLVADHKETWGDAELALPAPFSLLEHLVEYITPGQVARSGDTGDVLLKREALARKDAATIAEARQALQALQGDSRGRHWYVLEGNSRPDATLEMEDAVLLIEGKLTERSCTSKTKWMAGRSQLLRHMDAAAAYERFRGKRILGLLLVEGDDEGPDTTVPSPHWIAQSEAQYQTRMLAATLPHLSPNRRDLLAGGVLGVATWQAVCRVSSPPWPPVPTPRGLAERLRRNRLTGRLTQAE